MNCSNCGNKNAHSLRGGYYTDKKTGKRMTWEECDICGNSPIGVPDIWLKNHGVPEDAGIRQYHNFLASQEEKGKLGEVKDGHIQKLLIQKYGRKKVPIPWVKRDVNKPKRVII
jgi:hypothetical protein